MEMGVTQINTNQKGRDRKWHRTPHRKREAQLLQSKTPRGHPTHWHILFSGTLAGKSSTADKIFRGRNGRCGAQPPDVVACASQLFRDLLKASQPYPFPSQPINKRQLIYLSCVEAQAFCFLIFPFIHLHFSRVAVPFHTLFYK